jgi:hypothetical protein
MASSEAPPTYYFDGITFNPTFYSSSSSDYLTKSTGKSYFLSYPTAQGTQTISTLNSSTINSLTSTGTISIGGIQENGGSVVIGNNNNTDTQIKGGTIKLLNNTNVSGILRSNYLDSLEFDSNLAIAETQTTGLLQIANNSSRTGDIDFAKNATSGILTLGSNSNEGTQICGNIINLTNDTTAAGEFTSTGVLKATIGILSGGVAYETTSAAKTISSTETNQNYYLYCTGTTTYIITLPLVANTHQIVHIRNGSSVALTLKTNETGTKIYPNGTATVFTTTYGSFGANTTQNLYSNGTNWIGF